MGKKLIESQRFFISAFLSLLILFSGITVMATQSDSLERQEMKRRHSEIMEYVDSASGIVSDILYLLAVIIVIFVLYFFLKKMARKL